MISAEYDVKKDVIRRTFSSQEKANKYFVSDQNGNNEIKVGGKSYMASWRKPWLT